MFKSSRHKRRFQAVPWMEDTVFVTVVGWFTTVGKQSTLTKNMPRN